MREIKFRAWEEYEPEISESSKRGEMRSYESLCNGDYGSWPDLYFAITRQARYTPMQYTGLHDKNGKEIYEGDVVSFENEILVMKWHEGTQEPFPFAYYDNVEECEVIGNIYENPELLKADAAVS